MWLELRRLIQFNETEKVDKCPWENEGKSKLVIKGTDIELNGFNGYRLTFLTHGQCALLWHFRIWLLIWWKDAITREINCIKSAWKSHRTFNLFHIKSYKYSLSPDMKLFFIIKTVLHRSVFCELYESCSWCFTNQKPNELTKVKQGKKTGAFKINSLQTSCWVNHILCIYFSQEQACHYLPTRQSHMLLFVSVKHKRR